MEHECDESPNGRHEFHKNLVALADGGVDSERIIVDVWCRYCGACGSVAAEVVDIQWPTEEE